MDFIDEKLSAYAEQHTSAESSVLQRLNRETYANVMMPRMLSGHLQGRFLAFLSSLIQPLRILEIGTYTGYSAICLAEGLQENGILHTIDINEELETISKKYFMLSGFSERIIQHFGPATEVIQRLDETFDLVFIDADKENYSSYYELVLPKLRKGGLIIADNVLWSGKVLDRKHLEGDEETRALHTFNEKVKADSRVDVVLVPLRDGLMLIRKKM
jgi:caffeoyl-CoA O-methyltransferase